MVYLIYAVIDDCNEVVAVSLDSEMADAYCRAHADYYSECWVVPRELMKAPTETHDWD